MRRVFSLAVLPLLCLSALAAGASEWDWSIEEKSKCSDGPMMQMNECLSAEYRRVEGLLSSRYRALLQSLASPIELRESQRTWLRFRDATCKYEVSGIAFGGSLYPYAKNACLIDLTKKRIRDIDEYASWDCNGCPARKN